MEKQVMATSAISGPTAASSARGSAEAVVVAARREPATSLVGLSCVAHEGVGCRQRGVRTKGGERGGRVGDLISRAAIRVRRL